MVKPCLSLQADFISMPLVFEFDITVASANRLYCTLIKTISALKYRNSATFLANALPFDRQIFRAQFYDWEEAIAVDFTRTVESVAKRGVDMNAILEKYKPATDLRVLLTPRERALEWDEAIQLMSDWNEELVEPIGPDLIPNTALQQFIMIDGKWVPVEQQWFGHFFSQDSYIVIARYWVSQKSFSLSDGFYIKNIDFL